MDCWLWISSTCMPGCADSSVCMECQTDEWGKEGGRSPGFDFVGFPLISRHLPNSKFQLPPPEHSAFFGPQPTAHFSGEVEENVWRMGCETNMLPYLTRRSSSTWKPPP